MRLHGFSTLYFPLQALKGKEEEEAEDDDDEEEEEEKGANVEKWVEGEKRSSSGMTMR